MISPTKPSAAVMNHMGKQLPEGKTIVDVFADFMRYLFDSTRGFVTDSEPNGGLKWDSASNNIELVLTHPNGWGTPQQTQLRNAVVRAGIVPDTPLGRARVHFVTESEAAFNFCATHTEVGRNLKVRYTVPTRCWFADMPTAWGASYDYRCGWRDDRYPHLHGYQQSATPARRAVQTQV